MIRNKRYLMVILSLVLIFGTVGSLTVFGKQHVRNRHVRSSQYRSHHHSTTKGAIIGGLAGAAGGALVGGRKGAAIGAGAGAGTGYLVQRHRNHSR